jgi:outer membrane protein
MFCLLTNRNAISRAGAVIRAITTASTMHGFCTQEKCLFNIMGQLCIVLIGWHLYVRMKELYKLSHSVDAKNGKRLGVETVLSSLALTINLIIILLLESVLPSLAATESTGDRTANQSADTAQSALTIPPVIQPTSAGKTIKLDARYTVIQQPVIPGTPLTLKGAVTFADVNYPAILKSRAQLAAAAENVKVQKLNEYMPDSLFQYQEFMASHNQLTATFYGSPVFPGISGPGFNNINMTPYFSALGGFSVDWAPLDFGLHKARIDVARLQSFQAQQSLRATKIDVATAVANAFLDATVAVEQIKAAQENVASFEKFNSIVDAQISGSLKPAADAYLSRAQLANAKNDLIRADLAYDIAIIRLATAMGIGGSTVAVDAVGLATTDEPDNIQKAPPIFAENPIVSTARASLLTSIEEKKVLDKEYFPVLHFVGGANVRGSGLDSLTGLPNSSQSAAGTVPTRPNYQAALILNWNFLDIFRLRAEKKVQVQRIYQQQQNYSLVLQNLRGQDAEARAKVKAAVALAQNMPVQVESANVAMRLAEARYSTGLGSVAQVAEAAQVLANSRVKQASARIGVWRALLEIAYVHGDLTPFVEEADRVQRGRS